MNRPSLSPAGPPASVDRHSFSGYSTRDVAALLGLSAEQVRSYVRAGVLSPGQGARGEYLFSFQDLILLRAAKGLLASRIPHRRILSALENLRKQLPEGRPLTGVRITAEGHHVVVRDGGDAWYPESGQKLLDFQVDELRREASSLAQAVASKRPEPKPPEPDDAEGWFERGEELEATEPGEALAAYQRTVELDPGHVDAHLNLGRLLHERGDLKSAEQHYRRALEAQPEEATAAYNLGVVLQDQGRLAEAADAYEKALEADDSLADAHYNLAGVYEELGQAKAAFRHLKAYRSLIGA